MPSRYPLLQCSSRRARHSLSSPSSPACWSSSPHSSASACAPLCAMLAACRAGRRWRPSGGRAAAGRQLACCKRAGPAPPGASITAGRHAGGARAPQEQEARGQPRSPAGARAQLAPCCSKRSSDGWDAMDEPTSAPEHACSCNSPHRRPLPSLPPLCTRRARRSHIARRLSLGTGYRQGAGL